MQKILKVAGFLFLIGIFSLVVSLIMKQSIQPAKKVVTPSEKKVVTPSISDIEILNYRWSHEYNRIKIVGEV